MKDIKVTIVTASYNYENIINQTIDSVINQTYKNWELIIVDDGSKDNSVNVIKSYCEKDNRIKLYTHKNNENRGLCETLQLGISKANTAWIVFLESDDLLTPNYLEEKINIINNNPTVNFIYNDVELFGDEEIINKYNRTYFKEQRKILKRFKEIDSLSKLLKSKRNFNFIPTFSVAMMKKELLTNIDFNSPLKSSLDYYLWTQIAEKGKFLYIPTKLTMWRLHNNSYNNRAEKIERERYLLYKNCNKFLYVKDNPILAFFDYLKYLKRTVVKIHFTQKEIIINGKIIKFSR